MSFAVVSLIGVGVTAGGTDLAATARPETVPPPTPSTEPFEISVAHGTAVPIYAPLMLMQNEPDFCLENDVAPTIVGVDSLAARTVLITGEMDIVLQGAGSFVVSATAAPDDLVTFGATGPIPYTLFAQEEFESIEDLRGGTVAGSVEGNSTDIVLRIALAEAGLVPGEDIEILYAGDPAGMYAMGRTKAVDALATVPPLPEPLTDVGMHSIGFLAASPETAPIASVTFATTHEFLENNEEAVRNFVECYVRAAEVGRTDQDRMVAAISVAMGVPEDVVAEQHDINVKTWNVYTYPAELLDLVIDALVEQRPEIADLDTTPLANVAIIEGIDGVIDIADLDDLDDS